MPISYRYNAEANIIYETGLGDLTIEDFLAYRNELKSLFPRNGIRCLADYRNARVGISHSDMLTAASTSRNLAMGLEGIKLAICASDDLGYGMARMFSLMAEGEEFKIQVFHTMTEARIWLGLGLEEAPWEGFRR